MMTIVKTLQSTPIRQCYEILISIESLEAKIKQRTKKNGRYMFKGPYADHILIPQGSTGNSILFDIK